MIVRGYLTTLIKRYIWIQYHSYIKMTSLLVPSESVQGMTCLDRTAFTTTVELPFLKVHGIKLSNIIPIVKKYLFKIKNFKSIQSMDNETIIYLNPLLIQCFEDFVEDEKKQLLKMYNQFGMTKIILKYDNWQSYDILRAILPKEIEVPTSYSIIGHIVHLNLRDIHLPYKTIIGQVYLDTIPNVRTVLNKINIIHTTFRNFTLEILAGDKNTIATAKENGYIYELDFSQVYWNPRLSTEHKNLITFMKPNDVLYDVFAGVGPFAIPAACKGIKVFANDLNPESYKWLQKNIITNKVKTNIQSFNMDGRDFLKTIFKTDILNRRATNQSGIEHIIMNLPALAIEFLDVFFDSFNENEIKQICYQPPIIHLYCFVKTNKGENACKLGQLLIEQKLGCKLTSNSLIDLHFVRNISLNKKMIRISFLLTKNILMGEEPAMKKLKMENNFNIYVSNNITENNGKKQEITKETNKQKCV
ncbi:tRNA (guanine(37)-N1)-methyltransferase-like isoform X1 [Apis dorsata]|uniref:tRNA (guanine(37)-N1)-methyltransferase-like isoform X1 n=1 Tax=Apis dorsata TaxID=7462 RepID=UPI0012933AA7|nr:tRNA (guanine(37)-N1)-methyltransferase-like isoform X1 [Apis dorsata]